jgi:membrane-associated protein
VRANLFHRPVVALVGARLLPGGRLVSTAAAGRVGLPLRRFLPGSLVSSAVWSVYMLAVGMLLGPMVGGNPFLSLAAGVVMAVLTAGGFAVIQRLRARRRQATPVADLPPTAAPAAPALVTP